MDNKKDEKLICSECGCEDFNILKKNNCKSCEHNGAYNNENEEEFPPPYIYDKKIIEDKKLDRTQASEEGECNLQDYNYDNGCWVITCKYCGCDEHSIPCGCE